MSERSPQVASLLEQATTLYRQGLFAEALEVYHRALGLAPADPDVYLGIATSQVKLDQVKPGLENLQKALKLYPEERRRALLSGFARLLYRQAAYAEAAEVLTPVLSVKPTEEELILALEANMQVGKWEKVDVLLQEHLLRLPGVWAKLLGSERLTREHQEQLAGRQAPLVQLIQEQFPQTWQKEAPHYLEIISTYGPDHPDSQEAAQKWKAQREQLNTSEQVAESLTISQAMPQTWERLKQAAVSALMYYHQEELRREKELTECYQAISKVLADPSLLMSWLDKLSQNQAQRTQPATAAEAFAQLPQLVEEGENLKAEAEAALVDKLRQRVADSYALGGGASLRLLEGYFPKSEALPNLRAQLKVQDENRKAKAIQITKWAVPIILALLLGFWGISFFTGKDDPPIAETESEGAGSSTSGEEPSSKAGDPVQSLVNDLRVRERPGMEYKVVEGLDEGETATWTGGKSSDTYTATLRGREVTDYWYQVRTQTGILGWVFGGGIDWKVGQTNAPGDERTLPLAVINDPDGYTNLRQGPGTEYGVIKRVNQGERFEVESKQGAWWYLSLSDGTKGYMHRSRVRIVKGETSIAAIINDLDGYTNIRNGPGTGNRVVANVYPGQTFQITDQTGDWWRVKLADGQQGYLHRNQVCIPDGNYPGHFPQASSRYLARSELAGYSKNQLQLMRNEIFARHGYRFKSSDLNTYFSRHPWYRGRYTNVDQRLSAVERANIALMQKM